ncbi:MAG: hypothetical protein U0031_13015 [Thermomicrobiales bacterium]
MQAMDEGAIRIDVLQRLAEQVMSDADFRDEAHDDLPGALSRHGYDLNPAEMALVLRFRRSLEEAGVDLDLVAGMGEERLGEIMDMLNRRARRQGLT